MTDEIHPGEMQRIHHRLDVERETRKVVAARGMARFAEPAPRHGVHVELVRERRREVVVGVRRVADPGHQQQRRTRTAEVEVVNADAALHRDIAALVLRPVDVSVVAGQRRRHALRRGGPRR
ncbi:MAG TPA: hypothetical protein VIV65_08200 [Gemmatimonadaceae bacterium]